MPEHSPQLPVRRVTLYTSGVAFFERGGEVEGDTTLTLNFPTGQINDVLASLVLLDHGGGTVQPVTYGALDPLSKSLSAFSVNVGDNPTRAALLDRMRGAVVRVTTTTGAKPIVGTVLGVETRTTLLPDRQGVVNSESVNLLVGKGLRCLALKDIEEIELEDAGLAEELNLAISSVARSRDQSKRPLTLSFSGEGTRQVTVAYLAEAPAWRTSYRLVLGRPSDEGSTDLTARLQGWALVQNITVDDWQDVTLNLVSGRPISFIQDLYTPLYIHRPTVQSQIQASPYPQTYETASLAAYGDAAVNMSAPAAAGAPQPGSVGVANVRQRKESPLAELAKMERHVERGLITQSEFEERTGSGSQMGDALFAYAIDVPVTTPREQSAMIPFLQAEARCERVTVYNPSVHARHPLLGVALTNTSDLHLMGGPITVFATGADGTVGYTGQALIEDTEPGQKRLLTFALDLAVTVSVKQTRAKQEIIGFTIAQGVLKSQRRLSRTTTYTASNHDESDRTLVIEQWSGEMGWSLKEPKTADEHTGKHYRFFRPLAAKSGTTFDVVEEQTNEETVALSAIAFSQINVILTHGAANPEIREALQNVMALRSEIMRVETELEAMRKKLEDIDAQQNRIRQNLAAIDHGSDLYRRYIAQLDTQETAVAKLTDDIAAAEADLLERRERLDAAIAAIEL